MSEYANPFIKSFINRTNQAVQAYDGEYDATVLLNCLLGMLVIPFEKHPEVFDDVAVSVDINSLFSRLAEDGRYKAYGESYPAYTLIRHLRNSIAHFQVKDVIQNGEVWGFAFTTYEVDKTCEITGEFCSFKNIHMKNAKKRFFAKISIAEIKELSSIINDYVMKM